MESAHNIYLFGSSGLVGSSYIEAASLAGVNQLYTFSRRAPDTCNQCNRIHTQIDLSKTNNILELVSDTYNPHVINTFVYSAWQGTPRTQLNKSNNSQLLNNSLIKTYQKLTRKFSPSNIIISSTSGGFAVHKEILDEKSVVSPLTRYATEKLRLETLITEECKIEGIKLLILRMSSVTGPLLSQSGQGLINEWSHQILKNSMIELIVDPNSTSNFISHATLTKVLAHFLNADYYGIYNIASNKSVAIYEVLQAFKKVVDYEFAIRPYNGTQIKIIKINNSKLKSIYSGCLDYDLDDDVQYIFSQVKRTFN